MRLDTFFSGSGPVNGMGGWADSIIGAGAGIIGGLPGVLTGDNPGTGVWGLVTDAAGNIIWDAAIPDPTTGTGNTPSTTGTTTTTKPASTGANTIGGVSVGLILAGAALFFLASGKRR